MADQGEVSIALPAAAVEKLRELARRAACTPAELLAEALSRYADVDQLTGAIASGQDRSEALDDFLMEQVNREVHAYRAERRASSGKSKPGERRAS